MAWRPGRYDLVPRAQLTAYAEAAGPAAGLWAFEALRIARGEPRFGVDTDERTIPNEVGWIVEEPWGAVHLDKGCYRGQETVAKVHNLGHPPRRLVALQLDGSGSRLPPRGADVRLGDDAVVGTVTSVALHFQEGPVALAVIKRGVPVDAELSVDGEDGPIAAAQEVIVPPDAGATANIPRMPRIGRRAPAQ